MERAWTVKTEYMAVTVTCRVPPTVETTHVTQGMGLAWTVNMGFMVVTVIYRVPQTVKTTYVTKKKEHAFPVKLDGLDLNVKQNVQKDCTVIIAIVSVQDIVEATVPVIT